MTIKAIESPLPVSKDDVIEALRNALQFAYDINIEAVEIELIIAGGKTSIIIEAE